MSESIDLRDAKGSNIAIAHDYLTQRGGAERVVQAQGDTRRQGSVIVLHVSEAFGGGVAEAIRQYARAVPEVEQHLLAALRRGESYLRPIDQEMDEFASAAELPSSHLAAVLRIKQRLVETKATVLHVHSTYAMAYGSLLHRWCRKHDIRLVETPHGYAFTRQDVGLATRSVFFGFERLRSVTNPSVDVLAVGRSEAELARRHFGGTGHWVPHAPTPKEEWGGPSGGALKVVCVGRLTQQKDPLMALEIVNRLHPHDHVDFTWVGDGDASLRQRILEAGHHVTGWVDQESAHSLIANAHVYLHTAAWEGEPITVIEALVMGVPTVVRSIAALDPFELPAFHDVGGGVQLLRSAASDRSVLDKWATQSRRERKQYVLDAQRKALLYAWAHDARAFE